MKYQKNEKDFNFFPIILKGFSQQNYIVKIHVLDINALLLNMCMLLNIGTIPFYIEI